MKSKINTLASAWLAACLLLSPAVVANDRLDVVAPFEIQSAEPSLSGHIFTRMGVAETLVDADPEGNLIPGLATNWQVTDDGLTWRFTLRENALFHDQTPVTADSVANALNIALTKPGPLSQLPITEIAADQNAVVLTLREPQAALPAYLAESRAQILAPAAYDENGRASQVIGTGPYRITRLAPPLTLEAEAFDAYWGNPPQVPSVSYRAVGRAETRALMAEAGDAHLVFNLDPASVTRLNRTDTVNVLSVAIPRTLLLKVNAEHPFLGEVEARQALAMAIDRTGIARGVLRYPEGASQLFPPAIGPWHNESIPPLQHDPEAARQQLAALGWTPGRNGILERQGERFALTLTTYPDRPELPLVAATLEQQLRAVGIDVTINNTNASEIPAGHQNGSLDIGLLARNFALVPDPVGTVLSDYAPTGDWGAMGWENDEVVRLAQQLARGEGGNAERARVTEILQQELPVIPIAWYQQTLAVPVELEGVVIDPWERDFGLSNIRFAQ